MQHIVSFSIVAGSLRQAHAHAASMIKFGRSIHAWQHQFCLPHGHTLYLVQQKPLDNQQQQQRMPNGSYRGRGDPRRGRGRNDGPPGRAYRGGRGGRGSQGLQYGPPIDAPAGGHMAAANLRSGEFSRDAARPQRMANDGSTQGLNPGQGQGRTAPFGRGNTRGGGSHRGRGGRSTSSAQKMYVPKSGGEEASAGELPNCCIYCLHVTVHIQLVAVVYWCADVVF